MPGTSRWRALTLLLVVAIPTGAVAAYVHHRAAKERANREREASYQALVVSYARALPLGTTRQDVEAYLQKMGKPVRRMCCMESSRPADERVLDILTKIGVEPAPFYCSEHVVYVGFQFVPSLPRPGLEGTPSDRLAELRVFHWFDGCW